MAVVYRITNMLTGDFYIGSADSFARREWQHRYDLRRGVHKNPRLQASWNKHGADAFVFEVLEEVPTGESQLAWEDRWLKDCVGRPDCYNINPSAEAPRLGVPHTAETKAKTSKNRKGKHAGQEHYRYGQTVAPEVREKIGATQRGKPKTPGRRVSEEGLAKIRAAAAQGRYSHWAGRKHTEEARAKMSRPVWALSPQGVRTEYGSITALRESLDLKPPTVNRAVKSGKPLDRGPKKGWSFGYVVT